MIVGGIVQGFMNYREEKASQLLERAKKDKTRLDTAEWYVNYLQQHPDPLAAQSDIEKLRKILEASRISREQNIKDLDQAVKAPTPEQKPSP